MKKPIGVVSAGHPLTASTAELILQEGGNAFDAALASLLTACVAEPALASLGGGGFLLARPCHGAPCLFDFFTQTPCVKRPAEEIDFRSITVDFGSATQEFHVGHGSVAVPGVVKGIFAAHAKYGSLPMHALAAPAVAHARDGVEINAFQAYTIELLESIFTSTPGIREIYASSSSNHALVRQGEKMYQPDLASCIEALAHEGDSLFYEGEIAARIDRDMRESGGHLTREDLSTYQACIRAPLEFEFHETRVFTNPPPSSGGLLIAFATNLLNGTPIRSYGSAESIARLARVMGASAQARLDTGLANAVNEEAAACLLNTNYLQQWREQISDNPKCNRGTTHISVIDKNGNAAALTVSNGEGSAYVVPDTGVSMNNMLGEEDLNPNGFQHWLPQRRMTSMMAPSVVLFPNGTEMAVGSGGSNRIRSAILQVLSNVVEHGMGVEAAVESPRVHFENGVLSVEGGVEQSALATVLAEYVNHQLFEGRNMFFGGAHTAMVSNGRFSGAGDTRRGGCCVIV